MIQSQQSVVPEPCLVCALYNTETVVTVVPEPCYGCALYDIEAAVTVVLKPCNSWALYDTKAAIMLEPCHGCALSVLYRGSDHICAQPLLWLHYAKLSRAMRAPWVDRFLNNEIYCYPLSKKRCRPPLRSPPARRSEGIVTSGRQQRNDALYYRQPDCNASGGRSRHISEPFLLNQAMGLDAWASRVKCLVQFVSYWHIYSTHIDT